MLNTPPPPPPPPPPITHSIAITSSASPSSTLASSVFPSYYCPGVNYLPPNPYRQQQHPFLPYFPSMSPSSAPPLQSSSFVDADARERSRMARQRRSLFMRRKNAFRSLAAFSRLGVKRDATGAASDLQNNKKGLYSSLDNKKPRYFKKELKNSDFGTLGRILLPKKEAEKYLPSLSNKEGIQLMIRHTLSKWVSKSKCWSNNKSRMHVCENTDNASGIGSQTHYNKEDLYSFCTPDNKKLRLLFKKELKNSDTGSFGRIVLPKKEAEKYLPSLFNKEGIKLIIRDAHSNQEWGFKFKYWPNNKSRMYVFEKTGDFVRQSGVEVGDSIYLCEDECKNLYISIEKAQARPLHLQQSCYTITKDDAGNCCSSHMDAVENGKANTINSTSSTNKGNNQEKNANPNIDRKCHAKATSTYMPYTEACPEEDESSLVVLLQQHRKQPLETNMVKLSRDDASSLGQSKEASNNSNDSASGQFQTSSTQLAAPGIFGNSSLSSSRTIVKMADDIFDNCYEGLGRLPEVVDYCEHFYF